MRKAREEDTGREAQTIRVEHANLQKVWGAEKESRRQGRREKKSAREQVLAGLVVHLEPTYWTSPPAGAKTTVKDIALQLAWLRQLSRKVQVPSKLSGLNRAGKLKALVGVLTGLQDEKIQSLYAMNVQERSELTASGAHTNGSSEVGELEVLDESDESDY